VYDALVVPVLIGITIDESMFLLHAARDASVTGRAADVALSREGSLVASTALTTAAGFFALLVCRFEGLRDLGAVGAIGSMAGLIAALVVVPAGLRLADRIDP
jgi:predicted RND superfamily exporter protein